MWLQCFWWKSMTRKRSISEMCPGFPLTQAAAPFFVHPHQCALNAEHFATLSPGTFDSNVRDTMVKQPLLASQNGDWYLLWRSFLCFLLEILNHCKNLDDVPQSQFFSTVLKLNRKHLPRNLTIPSLHPPLSQKIQKLLHPATLSLHFSQANANVLSSG